VAFAASIGGLATPIGTPPNLIGLSFIREEAGVAVSFLGWCLIGIPVVAVMTSIAVLVLQWLFPAGVDRIDGVTDFATAERRRLGPWTTGQRSTAAAFGDYGVALGNARNPVGHPRRRTSCLPMAHPAAARGRGRTHRAILLLLLPGDRRPDGSRRRALAWQEAQIDWISCSSTGAALALGELCFPPASPRPSASRSRE